MSKHFFDYDDGDFAYTVSDNMAIDSVGNMMMRMGDNMAMDMPIRLTVTEKPARFCIPPPEGIAFRSSALRNLM